MAKGKLNQSREGMRELLIHHLRYEIDTLRCTFGRLHNPLLHECDKNDRIVLHWAELQRIPAHERRALLRFLEPRHLRTGQAWRDEKIVRGCGRATAPPNTADRIEIEPAMPARFPAAEIVFPDLADQAKRPCRRQDC
jgi:hypothetical protein